MMGDRKDLGYRDKGDDKDKRESELRSAAVDMASSYQQSMMNMAGAAFCAKPKRGKDKKS